MKTRLDQLTMAQFIDLACGDTSVITGKHNVVSEGKVADAVRDIVFEYRTIADASGAKSYIAQSGYVVKARTEEVIYKMCHNLLQFGELQRVREVMKICGIRNVDAMSDQRIAAEIKSRLEKARDKVARSGDDDDSKKSVEDIRRSFDEQTASLMAYFKFQIDTESMKASLYAQLVARYNREIKAQMAAMKK